MICLISKFDLHTCLLLPKFMAGVVLMLSNPVFFSDDLDPMFSERSGLEF